MKNLPSDRAVEIIADEDPNVSDDWFKNAHLMSVRVAALALDWSVDDLAVRVAKFVSQETEEDETTSSVDKLVRSIEFVFKDDIALDDCERETVKNLILRWSEYQDEHLRGYGAGYANALTAVFMRGLREIDNGEGPLKHEEEIKNYELSVVLDIALKYMTTHTEREIVDAVCEIFDFERNQIDVQTMLNNKRSQ